MKKLLLVSLMALLGSVSAYSQTYVLDNFNSGSQSGGVDALSSWNGQTTLSASTLTVGGTAKDDNGWRLDLPVPIDLSAFSTGASLQLTARLSLDNLASSILVVFFDDNGASQGISIATSSFTTGSLTTVTIPVAWTIDTALYAGFSIGGGATSPGTTAFRMEFDNLALTTAAAAIPEPSTYAAIFGAMALGLVAYRRRQARLAA